MGSVKGERGGPSGGRGGPAAIAVQLKCRASATQRQPPINKRDYRRTNKCAGGSFHGRPASQSEVPASSLSPPSRSFSFFLGRLRGSPTLSRVPRLQERVRFRHQRHLHHHHYLFFFLHLLSTPWFVLLFLRSSFSFFLA